MTDEVVTQGLTGTVDYLNATMIMTPTANTARVDLVVFDLDGTLVDSRRDICAAILQTLSHLGFPPVPAESLYPLIGLPLRDIFKTLLSTDDNAQIENACAFYRGYYFSHCADSTKPFDGVLECLDRLRAVKRAVCTGKMHFQAVQLLTRLNMLHLFDQVVGADNLPSKPDPAAPNQILRDLNVLPQHAWMVGDTTYDILAGKAAGMRTCALTCGTHDRTTLASVAPDLVLNDLTDFPRRIGLGSDNWNRGAF